MIRALIAAVLLTGAAVEFIGAPPDAALGYSLLLCGTLWFCWPICRWAARLVRRRHRRHPRRAPANAPGTAPHLTQINHHHYYYGGPSPAAAAPTALRPDYSRPALPRRGRQQIDHDTIYNTINLDGTG